MKKKSGKKIFVIMLVLVLALLAGAAGAAYVFMPETPEIMVGPEYLYRETSTFKIFSKGFGQACYYIYADGSLHYIDGDGDQKLPLENVRELYATEEPHTFFAITNDDELYAWGSNKNGALGDGTGNDSDSPIKIMDQVVQLAISKYNGIQALTADGNVYFWGKNMRYQSLDKEAYYEPVLLPCENIALLVGFNTGVSENGIVEWDLFVESDGNSNAVLNAVFGEKSDSFSALFTRSVKYNDVTYHLKVNGDLVTLEDGLFPAETVVSHNVVDIYSYYKDTGLSYLTADGALYSIGEMIGDGTKVPKDEFVKVRDDVAKIIHHERNDNGYRFILTKSDELMAIDDNVYVTKQVNVFDTYGDYFEVILFKNNLLHHYGAFDYEIENVKTSEKIFPELPKKAEDTLLRDQYLNTIGNIADAILYPLGISLAAFIFFGGIYALLKSSANNSSGYSTKAGSSKKCGSCKYLRYSPVSPSGYDCSNGFFKMTDPLHDACGNFSSK